MNFRNEIISSFRKISIFSNIRQFYVNKKSLAESLFGSYVLNKILNSFSKNLSVKIFYFVTNIIFCFFSYNFLFLKKVKMLPQIFKRKFTHVIDQWSLNYCPRAGPQPDFVGPATCPMSQKQKLNTTTVMENKVTKFFVKDQRCCSATRYLRMVI